MRYSSDVSEAGVTAWDVQPRQMSRFMYGVYKKSSENKNDARRGMSKRSLFLQTLLKFILKIRYWDNILLLPSFYWQAVVKVDFFASYLSFFFFFLFSLLCLLCFFCCSFCETYSLNFRLCYFDKLLTELLQRNVKLQNLFKQLKQTDSWQWAK